MEVMNPCAFLDLPTSNTFYKGFNALPTQGLLLSISQQSVINMIIAAGMVVYLILNLELFGFDMSLSPAWKWLYLACAVFTPLGYLLSYLFLWVYFKLDEGYFTDNSAVFEMPVTKHYPQRFCCAPGKGSYDLTKGRWVDCKTGHPGQNCAQNL